MLINSNNTRKGPNCSQTKQPMRWNTFLDTWYTTTTVKESPTFYLYSVEHNFPTHYKSSCLPESPMLSTFFHMNPFMQRKKTRGNTNELALVKAAAWAWYQHGSGSEGKQMREFDITRSRQAPGSSRYRLEAMRTAKEAMERSRSSSAHSSIHTSNSLLDAFEIESISRQLDCLVGSSGNNFYTRFLAGDNVHQENVKLLDKVDTGGMKKKKKKVKGFWPRHAIACGTREDVVDARVFRDRRRPEKRVPAVILTACRPRASLSWWSIAILDFGLVVGFVLSCFFALDICVAILCCKPTPMLSFTERFTW